MAAPTFVGSAPAAYDGTLAWPTSLPISACTPAGVQDGDRILCIVTTYADDTMTVTLPTPTNWTLLDTRQVNPVGQHLGLWIFSARWGADTKDQLVAPTSTAAPGRTYRLQCLAYRPSKPAVTLAGSIAGATGNISFSASPQSNQYGSNDGSTVLLIQATRNGEFTGTLSGFYALLPYSIRLDQTSVAARGGALRVADGTTTTNYTSGSSTWSRAYTGSTTSLATLVVIEAAVFDPVPGGWVVGRIAY